MGVAGVRNWALQATAAESTGKTRAATAWIARTTSPALAAAATESAASATFSRARASRRAPTSLPSLEAAVSAAALLGLLAMGRELETDEATKAFGKLRAFGARKIRGVFYISYRQFFGACLKCKKFK